jgi:hypothetical protein
VKRNILDIAEEYEKMISRPRAAWTHDDINGFGLHVMGVRAAEAAVRVANNSTYGAVKEESCAATR